MSGLLDQGYPVFLTGDFNEPSSLDYTKETVGTRKGIDEPVPWPVSEALLGIGLRDTYREEHPDPVRDPGITHPGSGERIDYVYSGGAVEDALQQDRRRARRPGRDRSGSRRGPRTTTPSSRASRRRRRRCRRWSRSTGGCGPSATRSRSPTTPRIRRQLGRDRPRGRRPGSPPKRWTPPAASGRVEPRHLGDATRWI